MREKDIIESLQKDIVIPDIVQAKADQAFKKIRKENSRAITMRARKRKWKTAWAATAAAVLVVGTTVCAAVYMHSSKGLEAEFKMTQEQKQVLEVKDYMAPIADEEDRHDSVTSEGVTITPLEMIVDDRFAWLSFQIKGYDLEEGKEPCFDVIEVTFADDPEAYINYSARFYNGITDGKDGESVYADGTSAKDAQGNVIEKFMDEEGCMEFIICLSASGDEKGLVGASIHISFDRLGTVDKAAFIPDLDTSWEFDMDLKGSDEVRKETLSASLGDSGATVTYAEISPISIFMTYDFPLQLEEIEGFNDKGEAITSSAFVEPPFFVGFRLKDGTLLTGIMNGGAVGYDKSDPKIFRATYGTNRIIDPSEVDALLYQKSEPDWDANPENPWTEENLYIVPFA